MSELIPRNNCQVCGATACFDDACTFIALRLDEFVHEHVPADFFRGPVPKETRSLLYEAGPSFRNKTLISNVLIALVRKYPRMRYAFQQGDFTGWPELDAACRLGGYEAALQVFAHLVEETP